MLFLVLPGCADLAHRFPPLVPPATPGVDPALDAQTRLLESAYRAFAQERYPLASALLQRFVDSNPDSPRLSEARWWLARSYEERGDLPAALSAYRALIGAAPQSILLADSYEFHALNRLDAFRRSLGPSSLLERRQIALWMTSADCLAIPDVGPWIAQLAGAGVTSLIVEAGSPFRETRQSGSMGVYFQTSMVPVVENLFTVIVPAAHAKGMAVLASLNLHEPAWTTVNPEWGTVMANGTDQVFQSVGHVDVLHPDYQRFVSAVAQDLLRTDIDGLVVGARRAKGFAEEWSPISRRMFEGLFGPSFDSHDQSVSPDAWRWAGWKTRAYLGFVARLTQQLRQTRQGLLVAVVVHERAVLSPADALTEYGEDVLETKQRGLHIVVQPELGMSERLEEQGAKLETVRQRLAPTAGDERQLWLGMALGVSDPSTLVTTVRAILATKVGQAGPHLLLMNRPAIP
ncbi:MAG: tetratricopeptide repeat protein [Nitrospiraceae bacterium]|nr:tetratricopeptide repeat protein [Nitrospiraceae bacterium]